MTHAGKKILILGVGSAQADAIVCAKRMGCEVFTVAYKKAGPGLPFADHFEEINIVDREGVLEYARSIQCDAVYSVGSDIAMPTVGYVAEQLGLACPASCATAELLNHKGRLRALLSDHELCSLRHEVVEDPSGISSWNTFPAIVKPVDSQGGRGVSTVHRAEDLPGLIENALTFSRDGKAIVEEYVTGPEFSINAFLCNGEMVLAVPTDRIVDMSYPCGVVVGHDLPAHIPATVKERSFGLAQSVVRAVGLRDGPAYFQLKHVGDDVFLIEATPRLDGCHIWRLINEMYGVDLLEAALRVALGESVKLPAILNPKFNELRLEFFVQKPNTPFARQYETPGALCTEWFYKDGDDVRPINGYAEKTGYQIRPD
jgi:biotin carboxylase